MHFMYVHMYVCSMNIILITYKYEKLEFLTLSVIQIQVFLSSTA